MGKVVGLEVKKKLTAADKKAAEAKAKAEAEKEAADKKAAEAK